MHLFMMDFSLTFFGSSFAVDRPSTIQAFHARYEDQKQVPTSAFALVRAK